MEKLVSVLGTVFSESFQFFQGLWIREAAWEVAYDMQIIFPTLIHQDLFSLCELERTLIEIEDLF